VHEVHGHARVPGQADDVAKRNLSPADHKIKHRAPPERASLERLGRLVDTARR